MKEDAHDEQSDAWQTVGAVTAKLLLHLMEVDFKTPDDVQLVENEPADDSLVESHEMSSQLKPHGPTSGIAATVATGRGLMFTTVASCGVACTNSEWVCNADQPADIS